MSIKTLHVVIAATSAGQTCALTALVDLLIDKGVLTPEEVFERFNQAADTALTSDGGSTTALPSQAIADFVRQKMGVGDRTPS